MTLPVWVVKGNEGKTLVVTAGVHGCEYIGVRAVQQLFEFVNPLTLKGNLIFLPLCNPTAFYCGIKEVVPEDGQNLNRAFPGQQEGSLSMQLAYQLEKSIFPLADALIDLHSGDIHEGLTPLVFYPAVGRPQAIMQQSYAMARCTKVPYLVPSSSINGLYGRATLCNVPSILLEIGCMGAYTQEEITLCIQSICSVMAYVQEAHDGNKSPQIKWEKPHYIVAEQEGFWHQSLFPNQFFQAGNTLGVLKDIDDRILQVVKAKDDGVVLYYTRSLGVTKGSPLIAYGTVPTQIREPLNTRSE